jgi:hypothetical protein
VSNSTCCSSVYLYKSPISHVHRAVTCNSFSSHYYRPYPLPSYCPHTFTSTTTCPISQDKYSTLHSSLSLPPSRRSTMNVPSTYNKQLCTPEHYATVQFLLISVTQLCGHSNMSISLSFLVLAVVFTIPSALSQIHA